MSEIPYLSLVIWTPIVGGILVLAFGGERDRTAARKIALVASTLTFLLSIPLYAQFDVTSPGMQFVERAPWIEAFGIEYYLGVDGISMPLIILTTFMTVLVVIAGWEVIQHKTAQ